LVLTKLVGHAVVNGNDITIDQASFGLFGGEAKGVIRLTNTATPAFAVEAQLTGVDMAQAMAFAGSPGTVTGKASGRMDIKGRGLDADDVIESVTGTLRLDVTDGVVKGLGLVKTIVLAGSGRDNALAAAKDTQADEPFSKMGMTLALGGGAARTDDLAFQSDSVLLAAAGTLALDGTDVDLAGNVQLSESLTQQAGRTLVAYTQQDGRVTIPVTVSGSAESLHAMVAVGDLMKRAATNKAKEEAAKALKKGLGRIIKR
jgi:AsmA protein